MDHREARHARRSPMHARPPITVVLGRFTDLLTLGLRAVLAGDPSVTIVADDIAYARLPAVLRAHRPAVLLLDVGGLPALACVRELGVEHPQTRLVLLGEGLSAIESAQALAFGAGACLSVATQGRDVIHAIHLASRGLQLMPVGGAGGDGPVRDPSLTQREGDVLALLRQGATNAEIALALDIGVETVRTHARHVYRKLGVSSRRALVAPPRETAVPQPATVRPIRRRSASRDDTRRPAHR